MATLSARCCRKTHTQSGGHTCIHVDTEQLSHTDLQGDVIAVVGPETGSFFLSNVCEGAGVRQQPGNRLQVDERRGRTGKRDTWEETRKTEPEL